MTPNSRMAILLPRMRRLFQYLETHGVVFIAPGETVITLREPSLKELATAVDAADLPALDHARLTLLNDLLFGEASTRKL